MTFEQYKKSIIEDFVADCIVCGSMSEDQELTNNQLETIHENFKNHEKCFNEEYEAAKNDDSELIISCIYGNCVSASIECMHCNEVIVDDETLFMEE